MRYFIADTHFNHENIIKYCNRPFINAKEMNEYIIEKPDNINEMYEYAKKLSKPFKFVRVDFYNYNGKVIFGELTFTPAGCTSTSYIDNWDQKLGDMLNI